MSKPDIKNKPVRCPKCGYVFGFKESNHNCKGYEDPKDQYGIR